MKASGPATEDTRATADELVAAYRLEDWLPALERIVRQAGQAILEIYQAQHDIEVEIKVDESPVTAADRAANRIIIDGLAALTPEIPVLSEESELPSFAVRSSWQRYWLVDPLDGTKEFIQRNGEFTVNVALVERNVAVLGVVFVPTQNLLYLGLVGRGAWRMDADGQAAIHCRKLVEQGSARVVASRRHGGEALESLLLRAEQVFTRLERVSMGSSLKICLLAEGKADWYPRLAPTSEWDTAAAQAVLEAAGGVLVDDALRPLRYNTKESLLNPHFHALADPGFDWRRLLAN